MRAKWFIIAGISIIAEVILLFHLSSVLLVFMFLIGRSDCPLKETLAVSEWTSRIEAIIHEIARASRLVKSDGNIELWTTPRGEFWIPGEESRSLVVTLAEQDMRIYGFGSTGVAVGDIVLDCGADVGTFTRSALRTGASLVIAVEPSPAKKLCLERNFRAEIAAGRVKVAPVGVWNRVERRTLSRAGITSSVVMGKELPGDIVDLTTIDNLVVQLDLKRVDFIKMDIEGAEKQALEGARLTLRRFKPRVAINCEHYAEQAEQIRQLMHTVMPDYIADCGCCYYREGRFRPEVIYFH